MNHVDVKYSHFLAELVLWQPWSFKNKEAYAALKKEFPALSESEAKAIVNEWIATQPQLLTEEDVI